MKKMCCWESKSEKEKGEGKHHCWRLEKENTEMEIFSWFSELVVRGTLCRQFLLRQQDIIVKKNVCWLEWKETELNQGGLAELIVWQTTFKKSVNNGFKSLNFDREKKFFFGNWMKTFFVTKKWRRRSGFEFTKRLMIILSQGVPWQRLERFNSYEQSPVTIVTYNTSHCGLYYKQNYGSNRTTRIGHQCRKTTVLSCHRCLINTIVENGTTFKYRLELLPPDVSK